jgi:hypothetical protein
MTREEIILERLERLCKDSMSLGEKIKVNAGFARDIVKEIRDITSEIKNERPDGCTQ